MAIATPDEKRSAAIKARHSTTPTNNSNAKKDIITMAQNPTPTAPKNPAPKTHSAVVAANGATPAPRAPADPGKKAARARVSWVSTKDPVYVVRSFKVVTDRLGPPSDPWGNKMVEKAPGVFGQPADPAAKAAREAAKLAKKAEYDAMTDDQKVAFATAERTARQTAKAAKKKAEYDAIAAQIRAEIAAGKL